VLVTVAPDVPLTPGQLQTYTYRVPDGQDRPPAGTRVVVPFGPRSSSGTVIGVPRRLPSYRVRELKRIISSRLTAGQIAAARRIAAAAHGGLGYTIRLFSPPSDGLQPRRYSLPPPSAPAPPAVLVAADAAARRQDILSFARKHAAGAQILVLVPEIWMTAAWAGNGRHILHSKLPRRQQTAVWQAIASGEPGVVVGTQKAWYLPWQNLKLIVVDEEQYHTHKLFDQYPRLDNRIAARISAAIYGARLLYACGYPSLAVRRAIAEGAPVIRNAPQVLKTTLADYTPADRQAQRLVPETVYRLLTAARSSEQVLLFSNRRVARRRIYAELPRQLAAAVTVGTRSRFVARPEDRFDLIVWLLPEQALLFPDFRSYEQARIIATRLQSLQRNRQQAVILATRRPEIIRQVFQTPENAWTDEQLAERRSLLLPPSADMVRLTVTAASEKTADQKSMHLRREMEARLPAAAQATIAIFGPYASRPPAPRTERHLLLQGPLEQLVPLYATSRSLFAADVMPEKIL